VYEHDTVGRTIRRVALMALVMALCSLVPTSAEARKRVADDEQGPALPLWTIVQEWDHQAEDEYSRWVEQLGRVRAARGCRRLRSCLENPEANALWTEGERWRGLFADCADLPYVLRAYFSYKTGRPFQFTNRIYGGRYGKINRVKDYADFTFRRFGTIRHFFRQMTAWIHSGFYRTAADAQDTDTYPVSVSRETIRPGTVFYEPRGHVLVVVRVELDGTIHMIDGHPDNSLTYKLFSPKIKRGGARYGGGFRNWRWYRYKADVDGGSAFVRETNEEITASGRGYDADHQYQSDFMVDGRPVSYHRWVQAQLSRVTPISYIWQSVKTWVRQSS